MRDSPYHIGWLLGCTSEIARCLITNFARNRREIANLQARTVFVHLSAAQYLQLEGPTQHLESILCVRDVVIIVVALRICNLIEQRSRPATPADPEDTAETEARIRRQIEDKETTYANKLRDAVVQYLYAGDEEHREIGILYYGWRVGESRRFNLEDNPGDFYSASLPVQYEPDNTAIEYEATGSAIEESRYSLQYSGPMPAEGECAICYMPFSMVEGGGAAVVARCTARCTARHVYHWQCLYEWVNESAMIMGNTCPKDREWLCEPRARRHPGE
jgi:hypothetical protein